MKISVTENARARREFCRDVVHLRLQFCSLAVRQLVAAKATEVMFEEEAKLPRELCFIECQSACNCIALVGCRGRGLNLRDKDDCLIFITFNLLFRSLFVNYTKLAIS